MVAGLGAEGAERRRERVRGQAARSIETAFLGGGGTRGGRVCLVCFGCASSRFFVFLPPPFFAVVYIRFASPVVALKPQQRN